MLRLFIAVDLPTELREHVARMMVAIRNTRWVRAEQLHITLRFLGDTPAEQLPVILDRLAGVRPAAFTIKLHGTGVFPALGEGGRRKPPKVLWLGIEPKAELAALKHAVDAALGDVPGTQSSGDHVFSPHLTLARFPSPSDQGLQRFLAINKDYSSPEWHVDAFHLYQSTLRREGALHERLASYPLAQYPYRE